MPFGDEFCTYVTAHKMLANDLVLLLFHLTQTIHFTTENIGLLTPKASNFTEGSKKKKMMTRFFGGGDVKAPLD